MKLWFCSFLCLLSLAVPSNSQHSSTPIEREVLVTETDHTTVMRVSLPLVTVYAAAAEAHGNDLAPFLLRKWLTEPEYADLEALNQAMAGFVRMLVFSVDVPPNLDLVAVRARRKEQDQGNATVQAIALQDPTVLDVVIDAVYAAPKSGQLFVGLANINLPLDHHLVTHTEDRRADPPTKRTWIGHLDSALSFDAPSQ